MNGPEGVTLLGRPSLRFRLLPAADVPHAAVLETASYPADEAATPEKLEYRQRVAPELFYGVYENDALIGFVVSTAAQGDTLEEETMSTHSPGGASICIHSVVVAAAHRRRGIAKAMVKAYVDAIAIDRERCGFARQLLLIAKAPLLGLYVQCGFELIGLSAVVHGADPWFDMRLDLVAKRQLDFVQVDAFTPVSLAGNPAAVIFTQRGGDDDWMQAVAVENNLSETAFLQERKGHQTNCATHSEAAWDIRWFTPMEEVALCGHATLGSAHALWETGRVPRSAPIHFHTRTAGVLRCEAAGSWIKMDFPAQPPTLATDAQARKLEFAAALGIKDVDVLFVGQGPATTPDWLIDISPSAFAGMEPNLAAIERIHPMHRGVIVTCAGTRADLAGEGLQASPRAPKRPRILLPDSGACHAPEGFAFLSRFFAPTLGVPEDPVTGSAHCVLAPYWSEKLQRLDGDPMQALQASPRGGLLRVRYLKQSARVEIEGQAVTVIRGKMAV